MPVIIGPDGVRDVSRPLRYYVTTHGRPAERPDPDGYATEDKARAAAHAAYQPGTVVDVVLSPEGEPVGVDELRDGQTRIERLPRGPGRPRGSARRWSINLWTTDEDRRRIEDAAERHGYSVAGLLVEAALRLADELDRPPER